MDSNHRRRKPADLQSAPVGHLGNLPAQSDRKGSAIKPNGHFRLKFKVAPDSCWAASVVIECRITGVAGMNEAQLVAAAEAVGAFGFIESEDDAWSKCEK